MSNYLGTIIIGSNAILTSVADADIISGYDVYNFQLMNDQACTISINGGDFFAVRALQGVSIDVAYSVRIHENGITFNWIGTKQ